nr:protein phosphatase 1 regulatory subunit 17 isoform X2 [Labrus bergylta]
MTTGCVRSTLEPEHRLMTQESRPYGLLESLVDRKLEMRDDQKEEEEVLCAENQEDLRKKPRRSQTIKGRDADGALGG